MLIGTHLKAIWIVQVQINNIILLSVESPFVDLIHVFHYDGILILLILIDRVKEKHLIHVLVVLVVQVKGFQ